MRIDFGYPDNQISECSGGSAFIIVSMTGNVMDKAGGLNDGSVGHGTEASDISTVDFDKKPIRQRPETS